MFTVGGVQEGTAGTWVCELPLPGLPLGTSAALAFPLSARLQRSVVKEGFARAPPGVEARRSSPQRSLCSWKLRALRGWEVSGRLGASRATGERIPPLLWCRWCLQRVVLLRAVWEQDPQCGSCRVLGGWLAA